MVYIVACWCPFYAGDVLHIVVCWCPFYAGGVLYIVACWCPFYAGGVLYIVACWGPFYAGIVLYIVACWCPFYAGIVLYIVACWCPFYAGIVLYIVACWRLAANVFIGKATSGQVNVEEWVLLNALITAPIHPWITICQAPNFLPNHLQLSELSCQSTNRQLRRSQMLKLPRLDQVNDKP